MPLGSDDGLSYKAVNCNSAISCDQIWFVFCDMKDDISKVEERPVDKNGANI